MIWGIIILLLILIPVAYFLIRYSDGDFSIKSVEEVEEGTIERRSLHTGEKYISGKYVDFKITYESGRVKYQRNRL